MSIKKDQKKCDTNKRKMILGAGAVAAGAALLTPAIPGIVQNAEAKGVQKFPYKKLNLQEVGETAYNRYFSVWCANTTIGGLFIPLSKSVGEPYKSFPLESTTWAHGGMMGWGTACGTLIGAGMAIGLIAGKEGDPIINDVIAFYANNKLPKFKPSKMHKKGAKIKTVSQSDSPLCHISVGKWMKKENVKFFTAERKERCARLAADIAMYTAQLLNEWSAGKYKPRNKPLANAKEHQIPTQSNCDDCHGDDTPKLPGT